MTRALPSKIYFIWAVWNVDINLFVCLFTDDSIVHLFPGILLDVYVHNHITCYYVWNISSYFTCFVSLLSLKLFCLIYKKMLLWYLVMSPFCWLWWRCYLCFAIDYLAGVGLEYDFYYINMNFTCFYYSLMNFK